MHYNNATRGTAIMSEGAPQGSPLSPVLWLLFFSQTLRMADITINKIRLPIHASTHLLRSGPIPERQSFSVNLYSYADDVNPLVISRGTTATQHKTLINQIS